jgi:hypothetical protein
MSDRALAGDIRAIPLADIFLLLSNNQMTGALRCTRGNVSKTLEWEKGHLVFARSTAAEDGLGTYLKAQGTVTDEQIQQASPMVSSEERLGKALVRLGVLTPTTLWEAVRGQTTEIVYSLFHWKDGSFEFREGDPPAEKIATNISVMNVIMEGTRRLDEWSRVKQKIQSDGVVLAPVKSVEDATKSVSLSEFERTVLGLVDGRRTVRETIGLAKANEFESWQALHALLSAGLIRIQLLAFDPPQAAAGSKASSADDTALTRTLDQYGQAVAEILGRAEQAGGSNEVARLRKLLRSATFERADLLRDAAIEPDGQIDRRVLLANVAEDPPGERARNMQAALDRMLELLTTDLKGKVKLDDVIVNLRKSSS